MINKFKKVIREYVGLGPKPTEHIGRAFNEGIRGEMGDTRYIEPKVPPKVSVTLADQTIEKTEIYKRAKLAIVNAEIGESSRTTLLEAQRKQVSYGIEKYPEPLNPNTWNISETIEHIMDESIDRLHYLIMLSIKIEKKLLLLISTSDIIEIRNLNSRIKHIDAMIKASITDMDYIVKMEQLMNAESGIELND